MSLFGISDLHLSFGVNKPMSVFGDVWIDYEKKLVKNWNKQANPEDTVIIAGDISWAMTFKEAVKDYEFINSLPGKKIILKGNHDYYFSTKTKMEQFLKDNNFNTISVLYNNAIDNSNYIICGTRGWGIMEDATKEENVKLIAREEGRLKISLSQAKLIQKDYESKGIKKDILAVMHFPPFVSNFQTILEENNVKKCIYGHLHGYGHKMVKQGMIENIEYVMVGCDYNDFKLIEL